MRDTMNKYLKLVLYGVFIWFITFAVSFAIYPLRNSNRPLFESIMPVTLTFAVVVFCVFYFQTVEKNGIKEGIIAAVIWFFISLIIDLILFMPASPMQMTFTNYMMDIGLTYLIIIMIPIGFGYLKK